jgi:hypothetical protein
MWDENGKPTAAMARSGICIRGGPRRRLIAAAKELLDFAVEFRERTIGYRTTRIEHDIPRCSQFREPLAHHFPHAPLEAIAKNRLADCPGRGKPNPRRRPVSGQTESRKERPAVTESVVINFAELARS